jgi:hypothetical protein
MLRAIQVIFLTGQEWGLIPKRIADNYLKGHTEIHMNEETSELLAEKSSLLISPRNLKPRRN